MVRFKANPCQHLRKNICNRFVKYYVCMVRCNWSQCSEEFCMVNNSQYSPTKQNSPKTNWQFIYWSDVFCALRVWPLQAVLIYFIATLNFHLRFQAFLDQRQFRKLLRQHYSCTLLYWCPPLHLECWTRKTHTALWVRTDALSSLSILFL